MNGLATQIRETSVPPGALAFYWLTQHGFAFKSSRGKVVFVDPYLTDCVERLVGFKRLMASVLEPDDVRCDVFVTTHHHEDHFDVDAFPSIVRYNPRAIFLGPPTCVSRFQEFGIATDRIRTLHEGDRYGLDGVTVTAVYADHGELAPDAVGVILDLDGVRVYHMGDTSLHPEKLTPLRELPIDLLIPPINGRFGNLNAREAAQAVAILQPRIAVPGHFWMFAEQNGDPEAFMVGCQELAPNVTVQLITQGEGLLYRDGTIAKL